MSVAGPARRRRCCRRRGRRARPARRMWPIRAVVVDLPLVPVMATTLGRRCSGAGGHGAGEQLDVAEDLDAGGAGLLHRPVRRGMGQRHARRQHQGGEARPVGAGAGRPAAKPSAAAASRAAALSSQAATRGAAGDQGARGGQARAAQAEHGDASCLRSRGPGSWRARPSPTAASGWRGRAWPA